MILEELVVGVLEQVAVEVVDAFLVNLLGAQPCQPTLEIGALLVETTHLGFEFRADFLVVVAHPVLEERATMT